MDESGGSFLRSLAAVVFLAILGTVLARPILDSDSPSRDDRPVRAEAPAETPSPTPESSPSETAPTEEPTDPEAIELADRLPRSCLERSPAPPGEGAIAVAAKDRVSLATPQLPAGGFRGRGPVMWSPSGRFVAFARGTIYDAQTGTRAPAGEPTEGEGQPIGIRAPFDAWTWSPIADCIFGLTAEGVLVGRPGLPMTTLVTGSISQFSVTEDGRFLIAYEEDAEGTGFDLRGHAVVPRRRMGPIFEGLAPSGCNDTPKEYIQASCSSSRRFAVAIHDPDADESRLGRLWLMDSDGDPIRAIASGAYEETSPEWGPSGTGVLFLRRPTGSNVLEVWFLPEGGNPTRTPLTLTGIRNLIGHESFMPRAYVDWNSTRPTGQPVLSF